MLDYFFTGSASQVVFPSTASGTVDAPVTVTLHALDQYGNLAVSESRAIRVVSFGSATIAYSGVTAFSSGVTQAFVSNTVPGIFTIGLSDNVNATGLTLTSTTSVTFASGVTTRFVIQPPTKGTVDASITVTVRALDQFGNVATSEVRSVSIAASGAVTNTGVIPFFAGIGTRSLQDSLAENATLSLIDSALTGLDVTSVAAIEFASGSIAF